MVETNILTRKLKLCVIDENENVRKENYKFIRDSQYAPVSYTHLTLPTIA